MKVAVRAKQIMDENKIAERVVPKGFLLPLVDAAGNVDDPDLQEFWAQLLASGVADHAAQHPSFADTLKRMSADDARLLVGMSQQPNRWLTFTPPGRPHTLQDSLLRMDDPDAAPLARLLALGLIAYRPGTELRPRYRMVGEEIVGSTQILSRPDDYEISGYAQQFLSAVLPKEPPPPAADHPASEGQ